MKRESLPGFRYHVGIGSLAEVAAREDRVCVLNILGGESRTVTPVSHVFSSGNVVFGTAPGRGGQELETALGPVPVFNSVREGLDAGFRFNTGVVYLPPAAVRDGVAELVRVNPEVEKIVIVTEKVSVHDAREIRALGQANKVDIFGANGLGVADSWNRVRIGGALGGDNPAESLLPGSVAIFSNSGNFTSTIATYLMTAGWGTTTLISSGKDVYIHFAAPEFINAFNNDARSKAAVLYVEPGGYYEKGLLPAKPVIACVVGRWKARLSRAVGHAGAMAGPGDDAAAKEGWFQEMFGVDGLFTPDRPICSARGAVVTNIAHIPLAMSKVMELNSVGSDFEPRGDLSLKPWFGEGRGLGLPPVLDLPVVEAMAPYDAQIAQLRRQIGAVFPRQSMRNASGASQMDPGTQVTSVHRVSVLDLAVQPLEATFALPLMHEIADENDRALLDVAVAGEVNLVDDPILVAADAAREAGNAPNAVMATAVGIVGPKRVARAMDCVDAFIEMAAAAGLRDARDESVPLVAGSGARFLRGPDETDPRPEELMRAARARGAKSVFLRFLEDLGEPVHRDAVLAAISATISWGPLMRKRISRLTARTLPWYLRLYGVMIGASIPGEHHQRGSLWGIPREVRFSTWTMADFAFLALTGKPPRHSDTAVLRTLIGLLISNGPGAISAQGAKGAVSADGPQSPERVQINKAMAGFLTHTGYSHGGNGYEGIAFLIEQFQALGLEDPGRADHGIDLDAMAAQFAERYRQEKRAARQSGDAEPRALPGVHHPVFRDKPVNLDPREQFVARLMEERGEYNVFHDFYRRLVRALYEAGATPYVFCVNVDAVIAALLLGLLWPDYRAGRMSEGDLERAAFTVFLYARMIGAAAEIDDHLNRGRNMDTRTPADQLSFVS